MVTTRDVASLSIGAGGWVDYADADVPEWVSVRVQPDPNGRLVIVELHLARDRVDSDALRRLPLGRIEAMVNDPRHVDAIRAHAATAPRPEVEPAAGQRRQRWAPKEITWEVELDVPKGRKPEAFWRQLADVYRDAAALSRRPAAEIAEAVGVPVVTVHRWVAEARKRGLLPPASPGRRG
jgi:hypothetical protein